jgi:hypothetical protein
MDIFPFCWADPGLDCVLVGQAKGTHASAILEALEIWQNKKQGHKK